jgi:predicted RNase H-like HicB family nuclease
MIFSVTILRDEDGVYVVECPSIPGCVSQGDTREKALEKIKEVIVACLEVRAELGMPLTIETSPDEFEREIMTVRLQPDLMELLARRSNPGETFTLDQVREELGLD